MTTKLSQKHVNILGVKIDSTSKEKVLRQVQVNIQNKKKFFIVTPNPEQVMLARQDSVFKDILNSADVSIADGVGIVMANKFQMLPRPKSIFVRPFTLLMQGFGVGFSSVFDRDWLEKELKLVKGREIFVELIKLANKKNWKVCLVGDRMQSAKKAVSKLKVNHLNIKIHSITGPSLDKKGNTHTAVDKAIEKKAVAKINEIKPELIFIGFGAPLQEKWLYRLYNDLDFVGAMVVGGTFDYVSKKKEIPPKWIEDVNLEWLWRLYKGDQKANRVAKAFPRFAFEMFWKKFRTKK